MEPGASPWQKNTRLKVIADQVFHVFGYSGQANFFTSGGQGALFEKTAPWTPAKAFHYFLSISLLQ